nr:retrovirus-related Pol polyprotein from transposon TNT 1-94 [Ipomoea batatas]
MASEPSNKEIESERKATITYVASSYALNSNDNLGSLITQVQLKGENYDEWVKAIRIALTAKKKFGFADGSIQQPAEDSPDLEDWWTVKSMIVSWILNTIEPTLRSTITLKEKATELWDDIKQRFSIANGPHIQQLRSALANCRQNGESISNYFGHLKLLWDELNNLERLPVCTCGGCKCSLSTQLEKRKEEERVHQFLMGLDGEQYNTIRSNILSQDPLPNLNRAYHMVVQDEQARTIDGVTCGHCHRVGHDTSGCFQLIGYPDWWGVRPRSNGRTASRGTQQQTGRGKGATTRVNVAQAAVGEIPSQAVSMTNTEQTAIGGISNEQWSALLAALSINKPEANQRLSGNLPWIIDTEASNHMTGTLNHMVNVRTIEPCPIGLPNGEETFAAKQGTVVLDGKLSLQKFLFVPKLNCNLISVSQLLADSPYLALFTGKFCVIQDRTSKTLIGAGEQRGGLYFLKKAESMQINNVLSLSPAELWHQRLGHPSPTNDARIKDKFASRSRKCVFIGYPYGKKGWYLRDLESGERFVSRDVHFLETIFPFSSTEHRMSPMIEDVDDISNSLPETNTENGLGEDFSNNLPETIIESGVSLTDEVTNMNAATSPTSNSVSGDDDENLGRGKREKRVPTYLHDYVTHSASCTSPRHVPTLPKCLQVRYIP